MVTMRPLCIYHGNCADGFGAAWVVWKYFKGEVDFHAGIYGQAPPDVKDREVIMVDFSYKRATMDELIRVSCKFIWLDHHKSAIEDMWSLIQDKNYRYQYNFKPVVTTLFSGAKIAWDYFFPSEDAPQLLKHIEDRDLWAFKLKDTENIQAALFSYPYDFEVWDKLMSNDDEYSMLYGLPNPIEGLKVDGKAITRKHHKDVGELLRVTGRRITIAGFNVPVANLPYTMSSDAGHAMGKGEPFAACYYDTPSGRCFSLRSADDGQDVSEIAKKFGGGGHKHSAGFTMPLGWEGD